MFGSAIRKAHDAVEGVAVDAALGLSAILLACGAFLFAAGGVAIWLAQTMPVHFALLLTAALTGTWAVFVYYLGNYLRSDGEPSEDVASAASKTASPLNPLLRSLSSMGASVDVVTTGLVIRQLKKSPFATIAAAVAVGALVGLVSKSDEDGETD